MHETTRKYDVLIEKCDLKLLSLAALAPVVFGEKNIVSAAKKCIVVTILACIIPANIIIITLKTQKKKK